MLDMHNCIVDDTLWYVQNSRVHLSACFCRLSLLVHKAVCFMDVASLQVLAARAQDVEGHVRLAPRAARRLAAAGERRGAPLPNRSIDSLFGRGLCGLTIRVRPVVPAGPSCEILFVLRSYDPLIAL